MNVINKVYLLLLKRFRTVQFARKLGVHVGSGTWISSSVSFSSEPYLIQIGDHVQVTDGVHFYTHGGGHVLRSRIPGFDCFGKIVVESFSYIGSNSLIMPGVTIGEGSLVAAGSVVTKSVPPHSVVGGNPARFICTTGEFAEKNMRFNVKTKGLSYDQKKSLLLTLPEEKFIKK